MKTLNTIYDKLGKRADRALAGFLNETQADIDGLGRMHDDGHITDCPCRYAWNGDSALNMDPTSWTAWDELDQLIAHVTGYDSYADWATYEKRQT